MNHREASKLKHPCLGLKTVHQRFLNLVAFSGPWCPVLQLGHLGQPATPPWWWTVSREVDRSLRLASQEPSAHLSPRIGGPPQLADVLRSVFAASCFERDKVLYSWSITYISCSKFWETYVLLPSASTWFVSLNSVGCEYSQLRRIAALWVHQYLVVISTLCLTYRTGCLYMSLNCCVLFFFSAQNIYIYILCICIYFCIYKSWSMCWIESVNM